MRFLAGFSCMKKVAKRRVERQDNENEDDYERDRRNGVIKTVRPCAARTMMH